MKFTTSYLLHPKESLSGSPDTVIKMILNKFANDTKCKTKLIEGKIVFSREKFRYSYWWLFARLTDGEIQITRKEPYLAIQGTIFFSNTILIAWLSVLAILSAVLIYMGASLLVAISAVAVMAVFVIGFNLVFSLISFNSFIKSCVRTIGDVTNPGQMKPETK